MWKKDEPIQSAGTRPTEPGPAPANEPPPRRRAPAGGAEATIGRSITIRGDVTGDEDLVIQGRIDGKVDLEKHNVTIGPEGRVKADIAARTVTIEGEVQGNVRGQEQVALRAPSKVTGDIVAPRVVLEDGATFLGSIDMSARPATAPSVKSTSATPPGDAAAKTTAGSAPAPAGASKT